MGTHRSILHAFIGTIAGGVTEALRPLLGRALGVAGDPKSAVAPYVVPVAFDPALGQLVEPQTADDGADNQAAGTQRSVDLARLQAFDGLNFDRLRTVSDIVDGVLPGGVGILGVGARLQAFAGSAGWNQVRASSEEAHAEVLGGSTQVGLIVTKLANFSIHHDPAAAAQATVTKAAAGLGMRHICTSIHATLNAGAAATGIIKVYLRDGAAGVGPILWSAAVQAPAAGHVQVSLSDLSILGSANTAMTLEFSAAGGAGSQENVALTGYSVF